MMIELVGNTALFIVWLILFFIGLSLGLMFLGIVKSIWNGTFVRDYIDYID